MKNIQFAVFNTDKRYGQMNANAAFYKENMSAAERSAVAKMNKSVVAHEVGFELPRLFMSLQGKERGISYTLKKEDVTAYKDLYAYDVYADIVKMTPETADSKTAIGFNVSDGANVIAMNLKTMEATSTFCDGAHINAKVPERIIDVLGGNPEDIYVDISKYAHIIPYYNENDKNWEPAWTSDENVWDECKNRQEDGVLLINQEKALKKQLVKSGILLENIYDRGDSYYDRNYYSSQRAFMEKDPTQNGRFMHGIAYVEEGKTYDNSNIKVYTKKIAK